MSDKGSAQLLLDVRGLKKHFPITQGFRRKQIGAVKAVDGVTFSLRDGETLGLVGESGCGKTTASRSILRAIDPTDGEVLFRKKDGQFVDLAKLSGAELVPLRQEMQMVFQDPYGSLNPCMSVLEIVSEPFAIHNLMGNENEIRDRVAYLLKRVGLRPEYMKRYPHAFSGGERQRIGIARALALNPRMVVLDEPVSALDVSVRAATLNLLQELQSEFGLTYLFVSHDLSVVEHIADRVAVMYVGRMVELTSADRMYSAPKHPYTEALLSAVPMPDPRRRRDRIVLQGDLADPANPPSGCYFHPRCRYAESMCKAETPEFVQVAPDHWVACHLAATLSLRGVSTHKIG